MEGPWTWPSALLLRDKEGESTSMDSACGTVYFGRLHSEHSSPNNKCKSLWLLWWTRWRVVGMESRPEWWLVKAGPHQLYSLGSNPGLAWLVARSAFSSFHTTTSRQTSASTVRRWGPCLWCLHLVFEPFKDKELYLLGPALWPASPLDQHATELWSTCWCSLKGTRMRKRRGVYTKPMVPGSRHPSLSALSNLLLPAIPPLNCGTSR